jgi:hypothetical protein
MASDDLLPAVGTAAGRRERLGVTELILEAPTDDERGALLAFVTLATLAAELIMVQDAYTNIFFRLRRRKTLSEERSTSVRRSQEVSAPAPRRSTTAPRRGTARGGQVLAARPQWWAPARAVEPERPAPRR